MLPHDIVHSMYKFPEIFHNIWTGAPGELEKYWAYNLDLADELGIQEQEARKLDLCKFWGSNQIAQIVLVKLFLHRFWVSMLPLSGVSTACACLLDLLLGMVSIPGFQNRYILISDVPPETRFVSTMRVSLLAQVRIYGDGADAQQHFELMSLLAVVTGSSSTLDSRVALSVRNCNQTSPEARKLICDVVAWSFDSLRSLVQSFNLRWIAIKKL